MTYYIPGSQLLNAPEQRGQLCANRIHFVDRTGEFHPPSFDGLYSVYNTKSNGDVYRLLMMERRVPNIYFRPQCEQIKTSYNAFDRAIIVYPGYYV